MEVNIILETIKVLGAILLGLVPIAAVLIQQIKESAKIEDQGAARLSLAVGFIISALVAWVYAAGFNYALLLGQWVGVFLFVAVGTVGPSGGYKVIGALTGVRNNRYGN